MFQCIWTAQALNFVFSTEFDDILLFIYCFDSVISNKCKTGSVLYPHILRPGNYSDNFNGLYDGCIMVAGAKEARVSAHAYISALAIAW